MRFFLLVKICRQQNTVSSGQIYAGLRAPQTPRARLAAWTASQNCVLLFQPAAFIPASAGQKSQTSRHLFYMANLSLLSANIITFFCPIHADKTANQSAKITAKNNKKRKPKLPYKKMLLQGLINCSYITCCNFCLFVCINYIQRPVHKLIHFGRIFLSAKTY